jgi:hypothetical protein
MDMLTAVPTSKAFFVIRTVWLKLGSGSHSYSYIGLFYCVATIAPESVR